MDSLHLHKHWPSDVTLVPNLFLDKYMLRANGEFVKIYMYLLRSIQGEKLSLSMLADRMSCTEGDILRAVRYWEKEGLLLLDFDHTQKLTGISFLSPKASPKPHTPSPAHTPEPDVMLEAAVSQPAQIPPAVPFGDDKPAEEPAPASEPDHSLTSEKVSELKKNEDIIQLLYIAEQYLGRPLTLTDTNKILYFYEGLKFDLELIEFLIEHCVSKNHKSIRYIEKVALSWAEQGISTVTAAKEETSQYSRTYFTIFKALGIQNRNPVKSETEFMDRWTKDWGFSMELVLEACRRTVLQTGSGSFPYTDKILEEWHAKKVHHMTDLEALDAGHKSKTVRQMPRKAKPNRFTDYPHRDYDFDQIKKSMFQA